MLDADSVFERLLKEAANLVPKMSTPKLTNAMKFTSLLQQKITDTVTSRQQNEKGNQQFPISNIQQISLASLFPSGLITEALMEESNETNNHQQQSADERQAVVVVTTPSSMPEVTSCSGGGTVLDCAGHNLEVTFLPPSQANCSNHLSGANEVTTSTIANTPIPRDGLVFTTETAASQLVASLSAATSPSSCSSTTSAVPPGLMLLPLMSQSTTTTSSNSSSSFPSLSMTQLTTSPSSSTTPVRKVTGEMTSSHCLPDGNNSSTASENASQGMLLPLPAVCQSADVDETAVALHGGIEGSYNGKLDATSRVTITQLPPPTLQQHHNGTSADHSSLCLTSAISASCSMDMKPEPVDSGRLTMLGYKSSQSSLPLPMVPGGVSAPSTSTPSAACMDLVSSLGFSHSATELPPVPPGSITSFSSPLLAQLPVPVVSSTCAVDSGGVGAGTTNSLSSNPDLVLINVASSAGTTQTPTMLHTPGSNKLSSTTPTSGTATSLSSSVGAPSMGGPYRCRDCDKEFRILRYLEKHRRIHTGEKPYQCCYCGRQFNDWPNMNRHKRIHTGERPYRCSVCTKTFSQPAVYNEHVKRHTGERPHICIVCAKGFPRAARLAVHMRVHTGERPYPCTSCDRRFSQPHHLAAHLRVHSGDRPYACSKCHVSFACISNLRRHRKQVHPNSPVLPSELSNENNTSTAGEVVITLTTDEKKPSLHCLNLGTMTTTNSGTNSSNNNTTAKPATDGTAGLNVSDPSSSSMASLAAAAAAMSGGLLSGAALVPATGGTSIPGLILTQGPHGTLIATAPGQFVEHHQQHGQPQLIATHATGLPHGLTDSSGLFSVVTSTGSFSMAPPPVSDVLFKSVSSLPSSTTFSFMLPTMLTATSGASNSGSATAGGPATVAFIAPHAELTTGTASAGLHDATGTAVPVSAAGGLVVNSASGETVYLEPLDPRLTFEHGQQHFTLATIPAASVGTPGVNAGGNAYPILAATGGHPLHLQPGPGGAAHIAFAASPANPGQPQQQQQHSNNSSTAHLLTTSPAFSSSPSLATAQQQQHVYTSSGQQHPAATILFPSQQQQQQQTVVVSSAGGPSTPSQMLHYHRTGATASNSGVATPHVGNGGRPSSTPTTMLVPIVQHQHHQQQATGVSEPLSDSMTTMGWPIAAAGANFVTLATAAAAVSGAGTTAMVLSPAEVATLANSSSRPASVLSNLSPSPSTGTVGVVPTSSGSSVVAEANL